MIIQMEDKIKIAFCLSGEPRSTMASFPYIYESFLNNPNYEVDVYIHSWKGFRALELYNPKKYIIDPYDSFFYFKEYLDNTLNNTLNNFHLTLNVHPLKNTFLMFLSMIKCFELIEKKYDLYIRSRLDLFFEYKLNLDNLIAQFFLNEKTDMLFDPLYLSSLNKWSINDQVFFSNLKGINILKQILIDLIPLSTQIQSDSPELILENFLKKNDINIFKCNIPDSHLIKSSKIFSTNFNFKDE